jgi:glycosyltransferase involved in cell wall biosynthesis
VLRVLLAASSLPPHEHSGAPHTTFGYAKELAARGHVVAVLHATPHGGSWECRPVQGADEQFARVLVPRFVDDDRDVAWSLTAAARDLHPAASAGFERLLGDFVPDVFHMVNNTRLPLDLVEIAKRRGVPVVRSITGTEDLCGLVSPVSPVSPGGVCAAPLSPRQCTRCVLAARPDWLRGLAPPDDLEAAVEVLLERKRARVVHQLVELADAVVFPSAAFRVGFERSLPLPPARAQVVEMGIDVSTWGGGDVASRRPVRTRDPDAPVTFVAASSMSVAKGTTDVVDAFGSPALQARHDWRLRLVGGGDRALAAPIAHHPDVSVEDAYAPDDLPGLLADADVGLAVSRAETFHRGTREYFLAGLPVVGTPVGGIPQIVRDGVNGRLVDVARPEALAAAVLEVLEQPGRLAALRQAACTTFVRPLTDEVDELVGIYEGVATATVA